MPGWFKIHRKLIKHWCASDPNFLAVWIRLLSDANFENQKRLFNGTLIELKRGQLIYGRNAFSKKSGVSVSKLRRIIRILEIDQMISQQKTNKYTIISITKYEDYQLVDQQTASRRPADDHQTTTPKERKEGKEHKSKKGSRLSDDWTLPGEYRVHAIEKGIHENNVSDLAEAFKDHWLAKAGKDGVKLDWFATWRTWVRNDIKWNGPPGKKSDGPHYEEFDLD